MLINLMAEMTRYGITASDISPVINKDVRAVKRRISGDIEITAEDIMKIRDKFFQEFSLDYLLCEKPVPPIHTA
jgi:hypothetical protein